MTPGPDPGHDAGAFEPRCERERVRVEARAVIDVDEVQARRLHPDQELAGSRDGLGEIDQPEDLGATVLFDSDRFHGNPLLLGPV